MENIYLLLGEILQTEFGVHEKQIEEALKIQKTDGGYIGSILLQQQIIDDEILLKSLGLQFGLNILLKLPNNFLPFFVNIVPIGFLKRFKMVPIATSDHIFIAVANPLSLQQVDDLRQKLNWITAEIILTSEREIYSTINKAYEMTSQDVADRVVQDMQDEDPEAILHAIEGTADLLDDPSDVPVIKLVNLMLSQAVRDSASDIHIEPYKDIVKIRKRIDGILYDMYSPPNHILGKLVSRIKIMAGLDIAEKRLPQDGRIEIRIADRNVDIRVSTLPTAFGERIVMRLLDKSSIYLPLESLGLLPNDFQRFSNIIKAPHGIILVTGPTGSGKTTTLYSALGILNKPDVNIITVEDPIEYQMDGINQMQVNSKIGLTFARGLRTIVRQDPDIILVGEIRDLETASIAIQAALTGHLVFSTLHTNDAASAITRLIEMGIEPFLVASSVTAILAQRLVRRICPFCRTSFKPSGEYLEKSGFSAQEIGDRLLYKSHGCPECFDTGYKGRVGIFELMPFVDELKRSALVTADAGQIKERALELDEVGLVTLRQDGLRKVLAGETTIEEVFRVT